MDCFGWKAVCPLHNTCPSGKAVNYPDPGAADYPALLSLADKTRCLCTNRFRLQTKAGQVGLHPSQPLVNQGKWDVAHDRQPDPISRMSRSIRLLSPIMESPSRSRRATRASCSIGREAGSAFPLRPRCRISARSRPPCGSRYSRAARRTASTLPKGSKASPCSSVKELFCSGNDFRCRPRPGMGRAARRVSSPPEPRTPPSWSAMASTPSKVFLGNGALVAEDCTVPGSVQSVGNLGIAVGHWPVRPLRTLSGNDLPIHPAEIRPAAGHPGHCSDSCCVDWRKLLMSSCASSRRGEFPRATGKRRGEACGSGQRDPASAARRLQSRHVQQLAFIRTMMAAIRRRDVDALERVVASLRPTVLALDPATQADLSNLYSDAFASYGLRGSDWITLMKLLCLLPAGLGRKGMLPWPLTARRSRRSPTPLFRSFILIRRRRSFRSPAGSFLQQCAAGDWADPTDPHAGTTVVASQSPTNRPRPVDHVKAAARAAPEPRSRPRSHCQSPTRSKRAMNCSWISPAGKASPPGRGSPPAIARSHPSVLSILVLRN